MKKVIKVIGTLSLSIVMLNCSSVKVADTWTDAETSSIKDKNVLVINKTDNDVARVQFETDMVKSLNKDGIEASESFKMFPKINNPETLDGKQIKAIKDELKSQGIDAILWTVLKDTQSYTNTTLEAGTTYYVSTYPVIYRRGYYRGFYRHYSSIYLCTEPVVSATTEGKKYILETVLFDLNQPEENQMLSVITTEIDNPQSLGTTSKDFSKKVAKELVK